MIRHWIGWDEPKCRACRGEPKPGEDPRPWRPRHGECDPISEWCQCLTAGCTPQLPKEPPS